MDRQASELAYSFNFNTWIVMSDFNYEFRIDARMEAILKIAGVIENIERTLARVASKPLDLAKSLDVAPKLQMLSQSVQQTTEQFQSLVTSAGNLSDKVAVFQKNTNLSTQEAFKLVKEIEKIDTRTSMVDRLTMASMAGKFNVAQDQIIGFIKSVDMVNVALGDEFGNNVELATTKLGELKSQFPDTKNLPFGEAMQRVGSMANFLGKQLKVNTPMLLDFMKLTSQQNMNVADTAGIGAVLSSKGFTGDLAASGLNALFNVAKLESTQFAKHLRITQKEVENLINKSPKDFLLKMIDSFKGADPTQIKQTLKGLGSTDMQLSTIFDALSKDSDLVRRTIAQANHEFKNGSDIIGEYALMNSTLGAENDKLSNKFLAYTNAIGGMLAPYNNVIQGTMQFTVFLAAAIPVAGLLNTALIGGSFALLKYGLGVYWVNGALMTTNWSLLGMIKNIAWFSARMIAQGVYALTMFAGRAVLTATMALPALIASLGGTSGAMAILNVVMSMNPVGVLILGIGALVTWFGVMYVKVGSISGALWAMWEQAIWVFKGLWDFVMSYNVFSLLAKGIDYLFGTNIFGSLKSWYNTIIGWLDSLFQRAKEFFNWVTGTAETIEKANAVKQKTNTPDSASPDGGGMSNWVAPEAKEVFSSPILELERLKQQKESMRADKDLERGISGVSSGGQKSITVNFGDIIGIQNLTSNTIGESLTNLESKIKEILIRSINSATQ